MVGENSSVCDLRFKVITLEPTARECYYCPLLLSNELGAAPKPRPDNCGNFATPCTLWTPGKPRLPLLQHPRLLHVRRNPLRLRRAFSRRVVVREHQSHLAGFRVAV